MTTAINANIGIMADSHGRPQTIIDALIFFKERGCEALYHLGDICDSAHPETADHCVGLLRENNILGIKGNNDHQVIVNHQGRQNAHPASKTIEYLEHLPMTVERGDALMAHSLPFVKERGLSCMVGVLGPDEAALFFQTYPHKMLLRGHSHYPEDPAAAKAHPGKRKDTAGRYHPDGGRDPLHRYLRRVGPGFPDDLESRQADNRLPYDVLRKYGLWP